MKAIIVAAGKGSRIPEITEHMPKCLIKVQGKSLIEREIEILHNVGIKDITVVIGHFGHMVEETLGSKASYVLNPFYALTNSAASLWFARQKMGKGFVYLHSDIIFAISIIEKLLSNEAQSCLAVQRKMADAEDMKVQVEEGRIVEINKAIPLNKSYGEFIGIAQFKEKGVLKLKKALDKIMRLGDFNAYFEVAVQDLIDQGETVGYVDAGNSLYAEVDCMEDLRKIGTLKDFQ